MEYLKEKNSGKKHAVLNMQVTPEMKEQLTVRAKALNVNITDLVRLYISRGLEQGNERQPKGEKQ